MDDSGFPRFIAAICWIVLNFLFCFVYCPFILELGHWSMTMCLCHPPVTKVAHYLPCSVAELLLEILKQHVTSYSLGFFYSRSHGNNGTTNWLIGDPPLKIQYLRLSIVRYI